MNFKNWKKSRRKSVMTFLLKGKMTPILNPKPLRSSYKLKFMEMTCWKITIVIILRKSMKYSLYWLHILSIKRFLLKISLSDKEIATHRFGWIEMFFFCGGALLWPGSIPARCHMWVVQCVVVGYHNAPKVFHEFSGFPSSAKPNAPNSNSTRMEDKREHQLSLMWLSL